MREISSGNIFMNYLHDLSSRNYFRKNLQEKIFRKKSSGKNLQEVSSAPCLSLSKNKGLTLQQPGLSTM